MCTCSLSRLHVGVSRPPSPGLRSVSVVSTAASSDDEEKFLRARSRAPNMPTCSGRVRARRTSECSPAVYDVPSGSIVEAGVEVPRPVFPNPRWIPDSEATHCMLCRKTEFWRFGTAEMTRHHCRACGWVVCQACSPEDMIRKLDRYVTEDGIQHSSDTGAGPQRVCCNCNEALGACEPADAHTAVEEPASLGLRPPVSSPRHSSLHLPASRGLPLARASLQKLRQLARQSL